MCYILAISNECTENVWWPDILATHDIIFTKKNFSIVWYVVISEQMRTNYYDSFPFFSIEKEMVYSGRKFKIKEWNNIQLGNYMYVCKVNS